MIIIQQRRARSTGATVTVIDNRDRSFMDDDQRWYTVCERHSTLVGHDTRALATSWASEPESWCNDEDRDSCRHPKDVALMDGIGCNIDGSGPPECVWLYPAERDPDPLPFCDDEWQIPENYHGEPWGPFDTEAQAVRYVAEMGWTLR